MTPAVLLFGGAAPGTTYWLEDTFPGGSAVVLDVHTPGTTPAGAWGNNTENNDYTVQADGTGIAVNGTGSLMPLALFQTITPTADVHVSAIFNPGATPAGTFGFGVYARVTTLTGDQDDFVGYRAYLESDGDVFINECDGDIIQWTKVGNIGALTAATDYELEIRAVGDLISAYVDGVLIGSRTDSTYAAAGYVGLAFRQNTDWRCKDFRVELL